MQKQHANKDRVLQGAVDPEVSQIIEYKVEQIIPFTFPWAFRPWDLLHGTALHIEGAEGALPGALHLKLTLRNTRTLTRMSKQ